MGIVLDLQLVWKGQRYSIYCLVIKSKICKAENVANTEVVEVSTDEDGVFAFTLLSNDARYNYRTLYNFEQSSTYIPDTCISQPFTAYEPSRQCPKHYNMLPSHCYVGWFCYMKGAIYSTWCYPIVRL